MALFLYSAFNFIQTNICYKCRNGGDTVFYSPFPPRFLQSELNLREMLLLMVTCVAMVQEFTPDTSVESTEEFVVRQQMVKEVHDLLKTLDLTERQVLVMRFGLCGHHRKSLQEIGTCFQVSKEWIRRVELKALRKLRDEGTCRNLSHYLQL